MKANRRKIRKILVDAIETLILPQITLRGFSEQAKFSEGRANWDYHRKRSDNGYDVFGIYVSEKGDVQFNGAINMIPSTGLRQPWGELVEAPEATAVHPLKRIYIQKRRSGILAVALPLWFRFCWFGFKPVDDTRKNEAAAKKACEEFIACLGQVDKWFATGDVGPNLVQGEILVPSIKSA